MDPGHQPASNPDHPGVLFYKFQQQGIDEHGGAGLEFIIVPSSPMKAEPLKTAVELYEKRKRK